ncbi:N-acetyllactosaminide beta-1,6-N-acetylglucosaminyl-transferase-like isoform X2 [Babylonia areolata]
MIRCRRRWKQWACVLALMVLIVYVLSSVNVHSSLSASPHLSLAPGPHPHSHHHPSPDRSGQAMPVIRLYDPFARDPGDRVGFRGLHTFDCVRAMEGFPVPLDEKSASSSIARVSDQAFSQQLEDCGSFKDLYGYNRYPPVTEEEARFPIAFNLLLYKEVEQVHVLLRAIYRPHNSYCLHVDGHALPQVFQATRRLAACLPNVFLATRRENITYSGFSRLQADLNCMADHWRRSSGQPVPWRYLFNLPSQQFPLKTNLELVKILTIYNGANDIEGISTVSRMLTVRFTFKHVYRQDGASGRLRVVRTTEKHEKPPHNITVVKGSAYGVFSRDFVDYVLHDRRAQGLLEWCRAVDSPDEYFWATLNHNPHLKVPGGYSGVPDQKPWLAVYASWPPRDLCESGKHVRGVCIFGVRDLPQLVSRKELFANKFYLDFQPQALHCLDQWLVNRTRAALPLDTFFYRRLPFIKR